MELSIINPFRSMYTMYLQICLLSRIRSTVLRRQAIEYRPTIMCKEHVFYTFSWYVHCLYVQVLNVQCNMDGIYTSSCSIKSYNLSNLHFVSYTVFIISSQELTLIEN